MNISFEGINQAVVTFNGSTSVGDIVTISDSATVFKAAADDDLVGVTVSKNYGLSGVMLQGITTMKYSGTAPAIGYVPLCAAGGNAVKTSAVAGCKKYLVLNVDSVKKTATIML